jgi:hypothetical protein
MGCTDFRRHRTGQALQRLAVGKVHLVFEGAGLDLGFDPGQDFFELLAVGGVSGKCGVFPAALAVEPEVNEKRISSV